MWKHKENESRICDGCFLAQQFNIEWALFIFSVRTFGEMSDTEEQYSLCRELCHDLAEDLQKEGLKVQLKNTESRP